MSDHARYHFADSTRPGLVLGLSGRHAIPLVGGVLWLALTMQTGASLLVSAAGPIIAVVVAFGRWRGMPLIEIAGPLARLVLGRRGGRHRWVRTSLLAAGPGHDPADLPPALAGLELITATDRSGMGVIHDRRTGTVTAALRVAGDGFTLSSPREQDGLLAAWAGVLTPFARERCPVSRITWHEWAHPVGSDDHRQFLTDHGIASGAGRLSDDYLALIEGAGDRTLTHEVIVTLTVDQRRNRGRTGGGLDAAIAVLSEEVDLFARRLDTAGLGAHGPLSADELTTAIRLRSDPSRARAVTSLQRSLAAAVGRASPEWGPMAVEPAWDHVRVDGSVHRSWRIASWPALPVPADWLAPLLVGTQTTRTVTVVMEPIPIGRATRSADREVMSREADHDAKERRGFRVGARDRKRLDDVKARETELSHGHTEVRFVGLIDIAASPEHIHDAANSIEQAAGQALLELRPLEARHDLGWVASLPVGRTVTSRVTLS